MSVLVVLAGATGAPTLARLGFCLARAIEEKLVVLWLEKGESEGRARSFAPGDETSEGAPAALGELARAFARAAEAPELEPPAEAARPERPRPEPQVEIRWRATSYPLRAVLEEVAAEKVRYLLAAQLEKRRGEKSALLGRKLFTAAPCHVVLVRPSGAAEPTPRAGAARHSPRRILVPTAGGPHAAVALRLAERLAGACGGEATALYVEPEEGELPREVGERLLERALVEARVEKSPYLERRVELDDDRPGAIARVAAEGHDLVLLGASNVGALRRQLFGTVPDQLVKGEPGVEVAVVRDRRGLWERLLARLGRWLDLTVPQMSRDERLALHETLQTGSEWSFDFMTLMGLSTAIATLGLLQNSAAVVIGAMLVAPLMTPILGAGLAILQGNPPLLRAASRALAHGYLMALAIGFVLARLVPIPELTPELLARGGPTLLDMGVGFFSGFAAAYCLGRPGLTAALPGVAIAAALVPPIATTGVAASLGESDVAWGAAILFSTNVVAIILGASVAFYAGGIRGRRAAGRGQRWARLALVAVLAMAGLLAVPLGSVLLSQLAGEPLPEISSEVRAGLEREIARHPGVRLEEVSGRRAGEEPTLVVRLSAPAPLEREAIERLAAAARRELDRPWRVEVHTELAQVVAPEPSPPPG